MRNEEETSRANTDRAVEIPQGVAPDGEKMAATLKDGEDKPSPG